MGRQSGRVRANSKFRYSECLKNDAFLSLPCVVSVSDPGLSVANIASQLQDTKARVVVVAPEAAPRYLEANTQLPPEQRVRHILVLGAGSPPQGCSPFRDLYEDDGAACPKQLPGHSQSVSFIFSNFCF